MEKKEIISKNQGQLFSDLEFNIINKWQLLLLVGEIYTCRASNWQILSVCFEVVKNAEFT